MNVPDIPKIYTALAEWFSCCVFVLALEKRYKNVIQFVYCYLFTSILCIAILYWRMACCSLDSIYGSGNDSYLSLYFQLL